MGKKDFYIYVYVNVIIKKGSKMGHLCERCRFPMKMDFDVLATHSDKNSCPYAAKFREMNVYDDIRREVSDDGGNSARYYPEWDPCMTVFRTVDNGMGYDITDCTFFRCAWSYDDYLKSPAWEAKRKEILERDGRRCTVCGTAKNLEVHHLTYDHFGDELPEELVTLCRKCHEKLHEKDIAEKGSHSDTNKKFSFFLDLGHSNTI